MITLRLLKKLNVCNQSLIEFKKLNKKEIAEKECFDLLLKQNKIDWANWLIARLLTKENYIRYAVYAAKQAIHIFESKYPDDKRPGLAIKAAEKYLKNPTEKNKKAANAVAYAVNADYADNAVYAAYAAVNAVNAADNAAAYAVNADMKFKIIKYGIKLLNQGDL